MHNNKPKAGLLVPVVLIALVSFAVYFNALSNGFVYDDKEQIVQNHWIRDIRHIPEIFSQSVWGFATEVEDQGIANYYRPFMHLVYMACYYLFGLKPWGFHLVNVLIHAGVSALVFLIVARLLPNGQEREQAGKLVSSPAFLAALLFATHPLHTEAVTWVAALPEVAFTFFFLLSLYFYMQFHPPLNTGKAGMTKKGIVWYVLSLTSFAVSVFFKEPALTLPIILIAYDLAFHNSPQSPLKLRGHLKQYVPYFIIAIIYLLLRLNALRSMVPTETFGGMSAWQSIINIFPLFMEYLKDLVFPFDLKFWHAFGPLETIFSAKGLLSFAVATAFAAAVVVSWKKNKQAFLGLVLILIPLLPAFYIKGIGSKPYAERYIYLPSVGFAVLCAVLLLWLLRKAPRHGAVIAAAVLVLAGAYSVQTLARNPVWKDDFTFYEDTIKKAPDAIPLRIAYGVALADSGRLDEAIEQYQTAIKLGPNYWQAHENLGIAYGRKGMLNKTIEHLKTALRINPNSAVTYSNLGNAYMRLGAVDEAIEQLLMALKLNPDFPAAHFNLGNAYEQKKLTDKAIEEYQAAVRLKPDYDEALYLLGRAYANSGRLDEAIEQFRTLARLSPDNASNHNTLGALYAQKGLLEEAIVEFGEAVRLAPEKPSYRENLEKARGQRAPAAKGGN